MHTSQYYRIITERVAIIILRYVPPLPSLFRVFNHELGVEFLPRAFSWSVKIIMWFLSLNILVVVCFNYKFEYIELFLPSRNKINMVMGHNRFFLLFFFYWKIDFFHKQYILIILSPPSTPPPFSPPPLPSRSTPSHLSLKKNRLPKDKSQTWKNKI